jgi:flavin prenyltransferase
MQTAEVPRRIVLALTGASGMPYALALFRALTATPGIETHVIVSDAARLVLDLEGEAPLSAIEAELQTKAARVCGQNDLAAGPASGSWRHAGMIVCPCSMASLAAIANGLGSNLIHRAADVTLKEGRKLVLVARETPLNRAHLKNMLAAAEAGAVILPACPGFYHKPRTLDELVQQLAGRILDQLDVPHALGRRWQEP